MEGCSKTGEQACPQLLDLMAKERREWLVMRDREASSSEEKKLELRLGPPGGEDKRWSLKDSTNRERDNHHHHHHQYLLSLGYFSSTNNSNNNGFSFLHHHSSRSLPVMAKESSQPCCTKVADLQSPAEKKAFPSSAPAKNTAVPNSSQKRYFNFSPLSLLDRIFSLQSHIVMCLFVCGPWIFCFVPLFFFFIMSFQSLNFFLKSMFSKFHQSPIFSASLFKAITYCFAYLLPPFFM